MRKITFFSQRGGVGKTTLVANLGLLLSKDKKVCLADFDLLSPNLHNLFGDVRNDITLTEVLLNDTCVELALKKINDSLYLLPSNTNIFPIIRLLKDGYSTSSISRIMEFLEYKLNIDYLIIDTHSGLTEDNILIFTLSDIVFIVHKAFNSEINSSIKEILKQFNIRFVDIINMVTDDINKDSMIINIPLYKELLNNPELLVFSQPNCDLQLHLEKIIRIIEGKENE